MAAHTEGKPENPAAAPDARARGEWTPVSRETGSYGHSMSAPPEAGESTAEADRALRHRYCRKCLLSEFDEAAYVRDLKSVLDRMDARDKAADKLYRERLSVCKTCDFLVNGTCDACGCYVELRAALRRGKCPYRHWKG